MAWILALLSHVCVPSKPAAAGSRRASATGTSNQLGCLCHFGHKAAGVNPLKLHAHTCSRSARSWLKLQPTCEKPTGSCVVPELAALDSSPL